MAEPEPGPAERLGGGSGASPEGPLPGARDGARRKRAAAASGAPGRKRRRGAQKAPRRAAPQFLLHETDNDMLLVIANVEAAQERPRRGAGRRPQRRRAAASRGRRVKSAEKAEGPAGTAAAPPSPGAAAGSGSWGARLPLELLVHILQCAVASQGAVPLLCRVACVCRLWNRAASSPTLWQKVSVGHCWAAPGQKQTPVVERRVRGTVQWLVSNRFSLLRDFTLCHWKSHVPFLLTAIGRSCPLLASLKLSHCSKVTAESLCMLAECCSELESLNLQNSQVDSLAVVSFLEAAGSRVRQLWLTYSSSMNAIMAVLSNGCCPSLQLLEVNTEIKQSCHHFQLPIEQLQAACPCLKVLRLLNIVWCPRPSPRSAPSSSGFPLLQELCLATTAYSFVDDGALQRVLWASRDLHVLDLRGCFRVTPKGLAQLPCPDLGQLYLGLYCSISNLPLPLEGSPLLTWKWSHSLRELDLTGQRFSERDLEQALAAFAQGSGPVLSTLHLTGTKVVLRTVSALIASCPTLRYLNLSSCRHLPRGMKKAYRGPDEIRRCLQQLLTRPEEAT